MKKLGCAKCGGMKKMKTGGSTKSVSISKPGAGVVKETKGDTNQKMGIYGIAQTGPTGPNNSGIATMKKGGAVKKYQAGGTKSKTPFQKGVANKDFKASDTTYVDTYNKNVYSKKPNVMSGQAPKTTKGSKDYNPKLDAAYKKTYGSSNVETVALKKRDTEGKWPAKESDYRKVSSKMKKGGAVKSKKK